MKKIMFKDKYGLTDAVLYGNKTMTRRVATWETVKEPNTGFLTDQPEAGTFVLCDRFRIVAKSTYKIDEVVAVAQCYEDAILDVGEEKWNKIHKWYNINYLCHEKGLHNKMFVRADLMPHQIRITDIKVEQLQDISDEDCLKEGIGYTKGIGFENGCYYFNDYEGFETARNAFAALINRICGLSTWELNPYVFAYTFELIK